MAPLVTYQSVKISSGVSVHYASAGAANAPTLLLLHGFPSSSNQFRNLIPLFADKYRVLAPDLPGFGFTTFPSGYQHNFDNMSKTIGAFLDELKVQTFAVYVFDYGAPTAFRLALERPDAIKGIITQNGNAYVEGFGDFWAGLQGWWKSGNPQDPFRAFAKENFFKSEVLSGREYKDGTPSDRQNRLDPSTWSLDYYLNIEGKEEVQLDLFWDYQNNIPLYPKFQEWMREKQVPVLAVWGKNDIIFIPPGAEAFKRDTKAKVVLLDGPHFLLESHLDEVAAEIEVFLKTVEL
jgi:pimeloyl-ACP methyl ester carboxylesterase